MMNAETKRAVMGRMRRIAGQVEAIGRMVEEDRYCVDLMHLLAAVQAALGQVGQVVLKSHVETCVSDALRSGDRRQRQRKIDELMEVFSRYGHIRER